MKPASIVLALLVALAFGAPALAAKGGNGNGNNGNGNGNGGSNSASEDAGNNGNGNGNDNGNGNGNAGGNGNGNALGHDKLDDALGGDVTVVPNEQDTVQRAVEANRALPLDDITALVQDDTTGRILDVQLVRFRGVYLYDVTVLEQNGVLHKLYYNARSGRPVRTK